MEKGYRRTRVIALLSAVIFASSMVLSGCSVKKITKKDVEKAPVDDAVQIGEGEEELAEGEEIVVGDDGQTYVSGNNTTRPYKGNLPSSQKTSATTIKNSGSGSGSGWTPGSGGSGSGGSGGSGSTSRTTTTTVPMEMPMQEVYNRLAVQRKFGFNKGYDTFSGLANFFLDSITAYFEYDDKYWLIEFWKGEYAIGAVGCEIGFYTKEINSVNRYIHDNQGPEWLAYGSVKDEDTMKVSMKLWQYQTPDQTTPVQKIDYNIDQPHWWAADFATGSLYKNSDRTTLVMVGSIQFPNATIKNLFVDAMKEKGFTEGSINTYHNIETLQVEGNKVTVCWKNYSDGYQVSSEKGNK